MVGAVGFEPTASCSQSMCATRLRYAPTAAPIIGGALADTEAEPRAAVRRLALDAGWELAG